MPVARALEILRRHGWNATSFQALEPGFSYFFHGDDAFVAYVDTGRAWVSAGAPVCAEAAIVEVSGAFVAAARANGRRACFFATEERFLAATRYPSLFIGEQPVWDPREWEGALKSSKSLREQLRRARAKGVTVRLASAEELSDPAGPTRRALDALISRWLGSREMPPMGFLVQVHPFSFEAERLYFLAEHEGRIRGFLAAVPVYARGGWFFEDLLREPDAPNGTAETLIDAAMREVAGRGSGYATLGLVPLAGPVNGALRLARKGGSALYDFQGLHAFKSKLKPKAWTPIHLAFPGGGTGTAALIDSLTAFAQGGLLRFGLRTLSRGPVLLVQALSWLLVPWTLLLAAADPSWFPSVWVKWAWVGFDALLAGTLVALSRRWRHGLGTALAAVVTIDAVLTGAQIAFFNAPRASGPGEWLVLGAALAGPSAAAALLWASRAHRRPGAAPGTG